MNHLRSLALACLLFLASAFAAGAESTPAVTVKVVPVGQPTTAAHQPIIALPLSGPASANLVVQFFNFTPTTYSWSQVDPTDNPYPAFLASSDAVTFSAATTKTPQVTVTFPSRGVYQLQVIASNGSSTVSKYVWVQIWDHYSSLNPLQRVGRNPGLAPPKSVRLFSPDPGPGHHPRLFFTNADWPEQSGKAITAPNVTSAITSLTTSLNSSFDKTTEPMGALRTLANQLIAYHDNQYDANFYTNTIYPSAVASVDANGAPVLNGPWTGGGHLGTRSKDALADALIVAAYLAWIGTDPTLAHTAVPAKAQARFRELCKITAAFTHARMLIAKNGSPTNPTHDLALVYDLLFDWMTDAERTDVRDYLYAIGYGFVNSGGGALARGAVPSPSKFFSNGNFANQIDQVILSALAIEGEEGQVSSAVIAANVPTVLPVTNAAGWPGASPATVWNMYRETRWLSDSWITPWGTPVEHQTYLELSLTTVAPSMLALARRGQNGFITSNVYQSSLHALGMLYARESDGAQVMWDHHDSMSFGNGSGTNAGRYVLKYMYPDDPLVDYVHRAFRNEFTNNLSQAIFDNTPGTANLATTAQSKGLSPTRFDPFNGAAWTRNSWEENDLSLYFECRPDVLGHMHAEANNFSLYALGRAWSCAPGYHVTINEASASVLVQDPTLVADTATEGYLGESPSSAKWDYFPTPPAKFLEATEDPTGQWTLFAGDATSAYQYGFARGPHTDSDTGRKLLDFFYDGWVNQLTSSERAAWEKNLVVGDLAFNPIQYALRTVLSVRGARPYVLVIDDITVDGTTPRNYRWNMPAAISFGSSAGRFVGANNKAVFSSLAIQAGATPTEAVLYHSPKDDASGPRLLVRDVAQTNNTTQPVIVLDKRESGDPRGNLTYGADSLSGNLSKLSTCRLLITREKVVSPGFKVLLFPYLTGQAAPTTTWNGNTLTINTGSSIDRMTFDPARPDHRTRMIGFARAQTGHTPPTLNIPADIITDATGAASFNGQPGAVVNFTVTATDERNVALTPTLSTASGSLFPAGVHTITASAQDSLGQVTTKRFTITVRPAPPTVTIMATANLPGENRGVQMRWEPVLGATAYSVKRATTPGGSYTVVSARQNERTFGESGLPDGTYYYQVTSWVNDQEGRPTAAISVAPPPRRWRR